MSPTTQLIYTALTMMTMFSAVVLSASGSEQTISEDEASDKLYPYQLVATSYFGRIVDSALPGSRVPVDSDLPKAYPMGDASNHYLRLGLISIHPSNNNQSTLDTRIGIEPTTSNEKTETTTQTTTILLPSLPPDLLWEVRAMMLQEEEGAEEAGSSNQAGDEGGQKKLKFTVDSNFFVVVSDSEQLDSVTKVEFWVVAVRKIKDDTATTPTNNPVVEIVSNPVAFIITIDHNDDNENSENSTSVYVGIIVLVICLFALLIPLTVRTKRRMREGKPLFAFGSSRKKMEDGEKLADADKIQKETGNGNAASEQEIEQGDDAATRARLAASLFGNAQASGGVVSYAPTGGTFQQRYLRTTSDLHFQPRWLDPHYSDTYEHPDYIHDQREKQVKFQEPGEEGKPRKNGHQSSAATGQGKTSTSTGAARAVASTSKSGDSVIERL